MHYRRVRDANVRVGFIRRRLSRVQIARESRKIAARDPHPNAMTLLEDVARPPELDRRLRFLIRCEQRRLLERLAEACANLSLANRDRLAVWIDVGQRREKV